MRVLQVGKFYHPYRGGMETYLRELCLGLKGEVDLEVLVSHTSRRTVRETVEGVKVARAGSWGKISSTSLCPGFPALMREMAGDIVQIQHPDPLAGLSYLLARPRGKLVIVYQSDIIRKRLIYAYYPFLRLFFRRARKVIVSSERYLESSWFLKRYRDKCAIIPIGIDPAPYRLTPGMAAQAGAIRRKYGERIVLFIGRLARYKGLECLLEAMTEVEGKLLIIGRGERLDPLLRQVVRRQLAEKVFFLGEIPETEIPSYLHACAALCLPSITRNEAFGICQLEAFACARPVVNTRLETGVSFINIDGQTGLSVPPRDARALGAALNRLLDSPALGRAMGEAGRRRLETVFSREAMVRATLELYQKL
jgi:rhamnosyl/mannosyltransferase